MSRFKNFIEPTARAGVAGQVAANFKDAQTGWRYHVWLNEDGTPRRDVKIGWTLYCNPPLNVERGSPADFKTRRLDAESKRWKPVIAWLLKSIDVAGALKAEAARRAAETAEHDRQSAAFAREALFGEHGETLLKALKDAHAQFYSGEHDDVAAAIRLIEPEWKP